MKTKNMTTDPYGIHCVWYIAQYGTKTDSNLAFPNKLDLDPDLRLTNTAFYKKISVTVFDFYIDLK